MNMKDKLDIETIAYDVLGNDQKGLDITSDYFLTVKKKNNLWILQVLSKGLKIEPITAITGYVKLSNIEDLRTSRKTIPIRNFCKNWKNWEEIIEKILIEIDAHEEVFTFQKEGKTNENNGVKSFPEDVEATIEIELGKILVAENQLDVLEPHLDNLIVGEKSNKQAITVLLTGSKHKNVKKKQMIVLKGTEGGGKSTIANELTRGYKAKKVGRFSAHALDYTNLKAFELLYLKEIGSMDMEKQGVSTLKFLSSDDEGYTVEVTTYDQETRKWVVEEYKIPASTVISTTTRLWLERQFERRVWFFNVDETEKQTEECAKFSANIKKQEAEILLGLRKITDYDLSREVYRRFIQQYKPEKIINPFPTAISKVLGFKVLRIRGDLNKMFTFLELYAGLNIKRLQPVPGKENIYILTPTVALEALEIIQGPLANMLGKVDARAKQILEALKEIGEVGSRQVFVDKEPVETKIRYDKKGTIITKEIRDKIALKIGKSEKVVRRFLNSLSYTEYVSSNEGKGRTAKSNTLLYDVDEIE